MASSKTAERPWASADDAYLDYVARPYAPLGPWRGKYRSEAWFDESASGEPGLVDLKKALQHKLGRDRVVYGVKERGGRRYWELYFYHYGDPGAPRLESVVRALPSGWELAVRPASLAGEVMFSFELSPETLRSRVIADVRAYSVSESKGVVTSRSFAWIGGSFVPENLYWPMPIDTPGRRRAFFAFASKALDRPGLGLDAVLPPELLKGCRSVCWAYKPPKARVPEAPNSIYLSTLTLEGLSTFLARHGYEGMTAFGSCEAGRLDHLLYDVGFDFEAGAGGPVFTKSGFYGLF